MRARRALGLGRADAPRARNWNGGDAGRRATGPGGAPHHKTRFVQDGEVPVVVVSGRQGRLDPSSGAAGAERARLAEAEAALLRERTAREQVERTLREAQAQVHDLQTRLGHADLARTEAQAAERAALERLDALARAEPALPAETDLDGSPVPLRRRPRPAVPARGPRRAVAQEPDPSLDSAKPVRWWLPRGASEGEGDDED